MPTKANTLYTLQEVIEISNAYAELARCEIAVNSITEETSPEIRSSIISRTLRSVIPNYYKKVPAKIRKGDNYEAHALSTKCKNLESKFKT
ncbi:MAG: hypothetical protein KC506_03975 [Nanoarchaeota archaeon]|nr:hypothetical protein [Nanoarchaeota archaeon]